MCVKDIAHYDAYDEAFLAYFKDVHTDALKLTEELREWLADPRSARGADRRAARGARRARPREAARAVRAAAARSRRSATTAATAGSAPAARRRSAPAARTRPACASAAAAGAARWQVADERRFKEYRRDVVLDVRQIDVALRGLRRLGREGAIEELDLDETDRQDLHATPASSRSCSGRRAATASRSCC